jgi:cellulose synthase/poly-beta-1,6-N-acetylglucosamine synthase-like glycosyltransferase
MEVVRIIILIAYLISLFFIIFWLLVFLDRGANDKRKVLKRFPSVSICIPAYNEEKNIEETLNSVLQLDYPKDKIEIIVVNDGSTDNTANIVKNIIKNDREGRIRLLNQKNRGKAAAMNHGLSIAIGEFFVSLDADSTVSQDALKKLLPCFESKNTAAVLPLIDVRKRRTILQKLQYCEYIINFFYKRLMSNLNCVHVTPGPFSVYRKKIIEKVGGFDERNLVEDMEMALRLQKRNYRIKQLLITDIETKAPSTFAGFYKQRNRWYKGSLINLTSEKYRGMLLNPRYGDLGLFQLPMIFVSAALSIILFIIIIWTVILKPLMQRIYNLSFIQFDFMPLFRKSVSGMRIVDINLAPLFYGIVIAVVAVTFMLLAFKHTRKSVKQNFKSLLIYFLIYPTLIGVIWIGIMLDLLRGKIQKW